MNQLESVKSILQGEAARYSYSEPNEGNDHQHLHYFKCIQCDVIGPFSDCLVSKKEKELEKSGYRMLKHHLEIIGLCPSCAEKSSEPHLV